MMELTPELRAFIRAGYHRAMCSHFESVEGGHVRRVSTPAYGSEECLCHQFVLKYNGEVV